MNEMNLKIMGQKQEAFEDYLKQLTEKMGTNSARLIKEQEEILNNKLQVISCDILIISFNDQ